ncbi:hypothetical protein ACO22_00389 [Paracoccidioides brasiliensis]|uniref:Uncharacterized protein n=1 Tax=Paracoccidioides brasiliensis TaxID=121759 RepID=A0A1D2JPT9_PARBR|nr:hypothetical protein ACO22_00389 [Paracoccidioides brasiliensis]ODH47292.1 hypothetical protein GX48_06633 [Paracoccidioides brasiliensis]
MPWLITGLLSPDTRLGTGNQWLSQGTLEEEIGREIDLYQLDVGPGSIFAGGKEAEEKVPGECLVGMVSRNPIVDSMSTEN